MKKSLLGLLALPLLLLAQSDSLDDAFLQSLEEAGEIASKTKLNIDDMPAFVTILNGKKLRMLGIQTVYEALGLVPGVELSMEASGVKQIIFRGVREKGEVKLMVDGVTVNNAYRGSVYYYLDFPTELVRRIEVIRGPGSVLYGSGAISGVINIITMNAASDAANRVFASGGTDKRAKGGLHYSRTAQELTLSVDGYYQTDGTEVAAGPDKGGRYGYSDESLDDFSVGLRARYGDFGLQARLKRSKAGMAFGLGNYLESSTDLEGNLNESVFVQGTYDAQMRGDLDVAASVVYSRYAQEIETLYLPHPVNGNLIYHSDYAEESLAAEASALYRGIEGHELVFGARYEHSASVRSGLSNFFETTGQPYIVSPNLLLPDRRRDIVSLYLNDNITLGRDLDLIGGIRWDHYSDFGDALSPRLGFVWRANARLNFKGFYSRSFRAPSWVELYSNLAGISLGNDALDAETADTVELGAVYKAGTGKTLRLNLFASQIDNLIVREAAEYGQSGKNRYYGAETEWIHSLDSVTDYKASGSYTRAVDEDGVVLEGLARFMANLTLTRAFEFGLSSGTVVRYVSQRHRAQGDARESLDGYVVFDQSFTYRLERMLLRASVKNLFDQRFEFPAAVLTYPDDYPRPGRTAWFGAEWEF